MTTSIYSVISDDTALNVNAHRSRAAQRRGKSGSDCLEVAGTCLLPGRQLLWSAEMSAVLVGDPRFLVRFLISIVGNEVKPLMTAVQARHTCGHVSLQCDL